MKVVLDSNVLLAALATRGLCETVFEACLDGHDLYSSNFILDEVKKHLAGKFKMTPARVGEIVSFLKAELTFVEPAKVAEDACRDPNDLMVIGTAVAVGADYIVSGDKDLLVLGSHLGIAILSPRQFYDRLK